MNRCPPNIWAAIKKATALLDKEGVRYALIGTAIDVPVPDADLLVEHDNLNALPSELFLDSPANPSGDGLSLEVDGTKIDYVDARDKDVRGMPHLDVPAIVIDGVKVATVRTVMAIKKEADRQKDRDLAFELASRIGGAA
jgi:hypothetical protein